MRAVSVLRIPRFMGYAIPMADPVTRKCCTSTWPGPHHPDCDRKGGRPVTTGTLPTRSVGRIGKIWDDCKEQAELDNQDMTAFVRDAITHELQLRKVGALRARNTPAHPDHPHTDPGDGRTECQTCGKFVWPVTHSCKGVPVTAAARARWDAAHPPVIEGDTAVEQRDNAAARYERDVLGGEYWVTRHPDGSVTASNTRPAGAGADAIVAPSGIRPWDGTDADLARFRDVE